MYDHNFLLGLVIEIAKKVRNGHGFVMKFMNLPTEYTEIHGKTRKRKRNISLIYGIVSKIYDRYF